ncbi:hypothetical protein AXG93_392s1350 [Marchantia polymorpha subsp. ruderalis]|uniref:DUF4371 domain-containing protein n=1 Tax=Marchantia polymorpha subsp. ruderalis TaxID=1480154 RepID=A0A176WSK9_MARPO|nr:hypothetical protein AXG93_392s1350 [Marchantia polymorpha subsp. ruderalis]
MEAFFDKRVNIEDRHRIVSIDKNIVEVVVYEMLYNLNDENHQLASDRAMDVFKPVLSIKDDGSKIVERFNVVISTPMEFDYVVSLLATGLSFNQISTVIDCNQTVLETGKQKSLSPREDRRQIGSSTDGASNMTGTIQGFSTRLSDAVSEFGPLYRICCLAHQLDIIMKASIVSMQNLVNFPLKKTLTTLVGYLCMQKTLI